MKRILLISISFLFIGGPVFAGSLSSIGTIGTIKDSNSTTVTTRKIGGTYYHTFSDGTRGTSRLIGGTVHHNFSDGTRGTSRKIGGTIHHKFRNSRDRDKTKSVINGNFLNNDIFDD